ncbi:MAG: DUF3305 domain-containing protein [Candidatus Thiodiazotropha sp.]
MTTTSDPLRGSDNPTQFNVSVVMQQSPSDSPWLESSWEAVGLIAAGEAVRGSVGKTRQIHREGSVTRLLYTGFTLKLHQDECESYYYNLLSSQPYCYVVANMDDQGKPEPFLVSISYDEAHAYLEGDETVYTVPLPAELYRWTEAFVLKHYTPQQRSKRKRNDWKSVDKRSQRHEI